jgi:hypothetical protein
MAAGVLRNNHLQLLRATNDCDDGGQAPPPRSPLPYALRLVAADALLAVWRDSKARPGLVSAHDVIAVAARCWADELAACAAEGAADGEPHDPALALVLSRLLVALTSDAATARQLFALSGEEASLRTPHLLESALAYVDSGCASLRDPLLPPLVELLWQWVDVHVVVDDNDDAAAVAAATHSVAVLTLLAATHARSAGDRVLRNDVAALLLHLVRHGGTAAAAALVVGDGGGGGGGGGDDVGPLLLRDLLLLAEPPPQGGGGSSVGGVLRYTREEAQLVQLVWHLALACCARAGAPAACVAALGEARLVEAVLGYLPQRSQEPHGSYAADDSAGGGVDLTAAGFATQRISTTTTTAAAAATRSSLRADAWPPSQRRLLEQRALSTLAALAPVVPEQLLASGAVPALVAYAQVQLSAFTAAPTLTSSAPLLASATSDSSGSSGARPGGGSQQLQLQQALLSLRIVTSLAGGGGGSSRCDGAAAAATPPALSSCAAAARMTVSHCGDAPAAADAAYWAACGNSGRYGEDAAPLDAATAEALRAATGRLVDSSGLLRDVVEVLRRYSWCDAVSPVPDVLLVACTRLLCAVFAPRVDAAEASATLEQLSPLLQSQDDPAAPAVAAALPVGTRAAFADLRRRSAAAEAEGVTAHAAGAAARAAFRAHGGLVAVLHLLGDVCGDDGGTHRRRGVLTPDRTAAACCVLQLLYAATVGDDDAEDDVIRAGGLAPLLAVASSVPPAPSAGGTGAVCAVTPDPVWEHAVGVLTALIQRRAVSSHACTAWRHPITGVPLLQGLLAAWARWLPAVQAHGGLGGTDGATASQAAAPLLAVTRRLHALITSVAAGDIMQRGSGSVDGSAVARPPPVAAEDDDGRMPLLLLDSASRFPALLEGAAWTRAAAGLTRVAADAGLPLTDDDAALVGAALQRAHACLAEEAGSDARRVAAAQAAHAHDLAVYTRHLTQLQADTPGGLLAATDAAAGGGGGGDDHGSVVSRATRASTTSGISWRLRQGGHVFTLDERKAAQAARAAMLARSFLRVTPRRAPP